MRRHKHGQRNPKRSREQRGRDLGIAFSLEIRKEKKTRFIRCPRCGYHKAVIIEPQMHDDNGNSIPYRLILCGSCHKKYKDKLPKDILK